MPVDRDLWGNRVGSDQPPLSVKDDLLSREYRYYAAEAELFTANMSEKRQDLKRCWRPIYWWDMRSGLKKTR